MLFYKSGGILMVHNSKERVEGEAEAEEVLRIF